jgi:hypothetical protein
LLHFCSDAPVHPDTTRYPQRGADALLAPMRWHTEDVAVQRLAATDSKIAFSISSP